MFDGLRCFWRVLGVIILSSVGGCWRFFVSSVGYVVWSTMLGGLSVADLLPLNLCFL